MKEEEIIEEITKRKNSEAILKSFKILKRPSRYTISKFLKKNYAEIHKTMRELGEMGVVEGKKERSERGVLRFRKVYRLTELGERILKSIVEAELRDTASIYFSVGLSDELMKELDKIRREKNEKRKNTFENR
jgi:DNA-binding PadR family transcriptional regulator